MNPTLGLGNYFRQGAHILLIGKFDEVFKIAGK